MPTLYIRNDSPRKGSLFYTVLLDLAGQVVEFFAKGIECLNFGFSFISKGEDEIFFCKHPDILALVKKFNAAVIFVCFFQDIFVSWRSANHFLFLFLQRVFTGYENYRMAGKCACNEPRPLMWRNFVELILFKEMVFHFAYCIGKKAFHLPLLEMAVHPQHPKLDQTDNQIRR